MKWCYFSIFVNNEKQYQPNDHHEHTPARPYPSHEILHSQITDGSPMFSIASQFPFLRPGINDGLLAYIISWPQCCPNQYHPTPTTKNH